MDDAGTGTAPEIRYVAIGDSFSEGMGDELPDGWSRGWADLTAQGWANSLGREIWYANLAIRGRLIRRIMGEQLDAALALKPTHLSFNGGGNDILRPRTDLDWVAGMFSEVLRRCDRAGVQLIVLSGANPAQHLPMGAVFQRRGDLLSDAVLARLEGREDVIRALNWPDATLSADRFWSPDRLHMNARGHHRVAARMLEALGQTVPEGWWDLPGELPPLMRGTAYYRQHVGPWIQRRLRGTSSGDGRDPKAADWVSVAPTA